MLCDDIDVGKLPKNYVDKKLFVAPLYTYQQGKQCGAGQPCDFRPSTGSALCYSGSNGSFVGAFACVQ